MELTEVEYHARAFLQKNNVVALGVQNSVGNTELAMVVEGDIPNTKELIEYMKAQLPPYMIPSRITCVTEFPLGTSGKTDRNALQRTLALPKE
ncbi:MAG: hypothetical protein IPO87_14790 [Flavobacteriales bacterium]|nr:hypothetical protein [Flavobacteriales bacterium]